MEGIINWLAGFGWMSYDIARIVVYVVYSIIIIAMGPATVIVLTWVERKGIGRIQNRIGPNRAGPFGIFQAFADAIKMLTKEDITPHNVDRVVFNIAPMLAGVVPLLILAVLPVAPGVIGSDLSIGLLYFVAVGGLSTFAILMAGWSSNNKFSLLGGFRTVATLVGYEVPIVIAIITVVMITGSMKMGDIVEAQKYGLWYGIAMPVVMLTFFASSMAEMGRSPFDLIEADSEIVAGYMTEYSGMKFALFFIGEYTNIFATGGIFATVFLGGWRGPFAEQLPVLGVFYIVAKAFIVAFVLVWVRGTLPRVRIDHMLDFNWKFLVPLSLVNLVAFAFVIKVLQVFITPGTIVYSLVQTGVLLVTNLVVFFACLEVVRQFARRSRLAALRGLAHVD
jgi:NADH-quinone oxidoreductase subunit H